MAAKTKRQEKPEKVPARQAVELVLQQAGKPMHYREITRVALELGIVRVRKGATEAATMKTIRSYLCEQEGKKFVRVDTGVFDLKKTAAKAKAAAETKGAAKPAAAKPKKVAAATTKARAASKS